MGGIVLADTENLVLSDEDFTLHPQNSAGLRDPMKFRNGDISLDEAIKANGGHLAMNKMSTLFDTSW